MKLHIREYTQHTRSLRRFVESLLSELIGANDKISSWEEYVSNYDPNKDYREYTNDPTLLDVKNDLITMVKSLDDELQSIPKVRVVKFKQSSKTGLSNYIEIKFDKPRDDKYTRYYGDEYMLNIRLSDHIPKSGLKDTVTNNLDITGRTFNNVAAEVINIVKNHSNKLQQFENNWKKKRKPSNTKKADYRNKHKQKREGFTRNIMSINLEPYVYDYLDAVNVCVDDIITELEYRTDFGDLTYREISDIVVNCLNANIIDYTFEDYMDWEMLANDVQDIICDQHSKQLVTV